jgi:hypothetical protein
MPYGMLRAATTLRSQPPQHSEAGAPLPTAGREATKGTVTPAPKVTPLEILGHRILVTGAAPTADHAAEIEDCPPLQGIKHLQCFLGMVNFYLRFLPKCTQVLKPLTDLLKGGATTF